MSFAEHSLIGQASEDSRALGETSSSRWNLNIRHDPHDRFVGVHRAFGNLRFPFRIKWIEKDANRGFTIGGDRVETEHS
ncbi:hypothetical protein ACFL2H_02335 [Planctomycetota bacterium]